MAVTDGRARSTEEKKSMFIFSFLFCGGQGWKGRLASTKHEAIQGGPLELLKGLRCFNSRCSQIQIYKVFWLKSNLLIFPTKPMGRGVHVHGPHPLDLLLLGVGTWSAQFPTPLAGKVRSVVSPKNHIYLTYVLFCNNDRINNMSICQYGNKCLPYQMFPNTALNYTAITLECRGRAV